MNNCVSKNSADFKSLYKEVFGIDNIDAGLEQILAAKISSWQDENGLDKWPLASDMRAQMTGQATMAYIKEKSGLESLKMSQGESVSNGIKEGVPELFDSNPELANAVYEALGFNNVSSEEISDELKDILTPKEDVYNRELYFSGVFQTSDEYDDRVNKELEPFLLPLIKKYVNKLMVEAGVHSSDIEEYNEKIEQGDISSSMCLQGVFIELLLNRRPIHDWIEIMDNYLLTEDDIPIAYSENFGKRLFNFNFWSNFI